MVDHPPRTALRNLVNFMCTPQFQQAAQYVAQQRALDAGISPQDAAANGGQYGVMPQPGQQANIADVINSIPRQQMQPQHMMHAELSPMPVRRAPTVGELLGIPPGTTQEVGGPGRF